ncbi:hypothetical protein RHGRI_018601 [Rhododendron griersonianum]|uniref:MLO-like protein n=1 Tax=Rhododendron griersonianum TaxID=479676 RepID=A0AAV6K209_9ERIC|nr:hypothetical protein RHGRI_018601 [Rhododendron griersonianum]
MSMAVSSGSGTTRELDQTPTWAVAGVWGLFGHHHHLHCLGKNSPQTWNVFHVIYSAVTMALGRLKVHLAPGIKFNFQKYVKRSLEDDFKTIVGVSPVLWASFVIFLLLNVYGWQALFWASLIPLLIILAIGTKLQAILTRMALQTTERHAVVQGIPLVQGSDKYFWFGRPQLVLNLIHFALFQNAFQITYFLWIWRTLSDTLQLTLNCLNELCWAHRFGVLFLCSYITLPLYALVAQMGSHMKKSIFDQQTSKALKNWHKAAKKNQDKGGGKSPAHSSLGGSPPAASVSSTLPSPGEATLHQFKTAGHSTRSFSYEDHEPSDLKVDMPSTTNLMVKIDDDLGTETSATPHPGEGSRNEYVHPGDSPTSFQ